MTSLKITSLRRWRARAAALLALAFAASTLVIGLALPANASICTTQSQGCPFPEGYLVTGTPDNSLAEWSGLPGNGTVIRSVPNGTLLQFICQINNGPQIDPEFNRAADGTYVPSRTWDLVYDPGIPLSAGTNQLAWVYDWWLNTPPQQEAYNWYSWSDPAHQCNLPS